MALSAPAAIVADAEQWTIFAVTSVDKVVEIETLPWAGDPGGLRDILSPRKLLEAKLGTRQLALFPSAAVVSTHGRSLRHDALAPRVDHALSLAATQMLGATRAQGQPIDSGQAATAHARAARAVIGALTAAVLRDKKTTFGAQARQLVLQMWF